ncbi:hypothetical protein TSUD_125100 [Trifolium subterraneum]|uniref:Uncharacterized protein n=1 Tax=Trifolium subterraneum TaxID=3900 RepID=A0A2Z6MKD1_TRISU|nr:hypothetical protein TSUD_125100 [Trifolium subterraneum]
MKIMRLIKFLINIIKDIKLNLEDVTTLVPNAKTVTSSTHSELIISSSGPLVINDHKPSSHDDDWNGQITRPSQMAMIETLATQYVDDDEDWDEISYALKLEMLRQFDYDLQNEWDLETTEDFAAEVEVQATSGHMLISSQVNTQLNMVTM